MCSLVSPLSTFEREGSAVMWRYFAHISVVTFLAFFICLNRITRCRPFCWGTDVRPEVGEISMLWSGEICIIPDWVSCCSNAFSKQPFFISSKICRNRCRDFRDKVHMFYDSSRQCVHKTTGFSPLIQVHTEMSSRWSCSTGPIKAFSSMFLIAVQFHSICSL